MLDCGPCPDGGPIQVLRVMAANLTSGNKQSYDPGHGLRIFQGLKPDVVMIQEFNLGTNSEAELRSFVDTAFGPVFYFYRETGAQIPNGVISRYPILASGEWTDNSVGNRDFAWARIDIPGPKDLWVVSLHLLTDSASKRSSEATQLIGYLQAAAIPAGDYLAVGGDLNTASRTESCIDKLSSWVVTASPFPADQAGNSYTNASRSKPYDWVLVSPGLNALQVPVAIGSNRFDHGLVFDSERYSPLSEVAPVQATDSAGSNMQHMAVVRDFQLP
jgi:endonuclease/exonuclease/phosphatase family metal-dependent hydrolase